MNTFPYDSWEEALEAATGYYTWGPGNNTGSIILALLAIILSVAVGVIITAREDRLLNDAADRLTDKYNATETKEANRHGSS